jgi:tetratricopeptide (TPR) repeat protein
MATAAAAPKKALIAGVYDLNLPPCVAENAAEAAAVAAARTAAREARAARLAALLAGGAALAEASAQAGAEEDDEEEEAAAAAGSAGDAAAGADADADADAAKPQAAPHVPPPPPKPREQLASAAVAAFLRVHETSDAIGLTDAVEQVGNATRMGRDALRDAAAAAAAALADCRGRALRAAGVAPRSGADTTTTDTAGGAAASSSASASASASASDAPNSDDVSDNDAPAPPPPSAQLNPSVGIAVECKEAGNAAYRKGHYEAALRSYTRAAELDPRIGTYHANRAAALAALARHAEAGRACVDALAVDARSARARERLASLCNVAGVLDAAHAAAAAQAKKNPESAPLKALVALLRAGCEARSEGKGYFDSGEFARADAAYTRGIAALKQHCDGSYSGAADGVPGLALLLCNRAAARGALGRHADALEDADAALALHPTYEKATARRAAAVRALAEGARTSARADRDALVSDLLAAGVRVPSPEAAAAMGAAAWGRAPCVECCGLGRDAFACRASLQHRAPDVECASWEVGGRVRFARRAAAVAAGASLGASLLRGSATAASERDEKEAAAAAERDGLTLVGTITAFDWPTGLHAVARDANRGTVHVRLRAAQELHYEPPRAPTLKH